jgi:hypothetical protein
MPICEKFATHWIGVQTATTRQSKLAFTFALKQIAPLNLQRANRRRPLPRRVGDLAGMTQLVAGQVPRLIVFRTPWIVSRSKFLQ